MIYPQSDRSRRRRDFASRLLALSILASVIASLVIATPVLAADVAAAPAAAAAAAPAVVAQANPFSDVPENSWAYDAVRQLAAEGLITGYPDNTFKGNRPMTRYEMAVLVNRAVNAIQSKIAQGGTVSQSDLDAIRRLVDQFGPEIQEVRQQLAALQQQTQANTSAISAIQAQNGDLQKQLAADEAILKKTAATVNGGSFHPKTFNHDVTFSQTVAAGPVAPGFSFGAANAAGVIANPASLTYGTYSGQQGLQTAPFGHAVEFYDFRLDAGGAPDPRIQWGVRLETKSRWSGTTESNDTYSEEGTSFASTVNGEAAGVQNFGGLGNDTLTQNAVPVVNQGWVGYYSPGGFFARIGRIAQDEGQNPDGIMLAGGQVDGLQVGFKNADWYAYVFPNAGGNAAFNQASLSSAVSSTTGLAAGSPEINQCPYGYTGNPAGSGTAAIAAKYGNAAAGPTGISTGPGINSNQCMNGGTNDIAGMVEYTIHSTRTAIGLTFDLTSNAPYIGWNPYAGLCVGSSASVAGSGATTTPGAGSATWNTSTPGVDGYCVNGKPLVYASGTDAGDPVTGAYETIQTNVDDYGAYIAQYLGNHDLPQFKLLAEGLDRAGNDPFSAASPSGTLSSWQDNKTLYIQAAFASKGNLNPGPLYPATGARNSNVLEADYYAQGLNSIDTDGGVTGTGSWETSNMYLGNYAGMKYIDLFAEHWFTDNFRAGLTYFTILNRYDIPAGSSSCPGCTVGGLTLHAIGADIYFVM